MREHANFVDLMAAHVSESPDRTALVFSPDPMAPEHDQAVSYEQLHANAGRIAALLVARCRVGDRVLLLHPTGPLFAESFFGTMYAGMVAVPAPTPEGSKRQQDRLAGIARDAEVSAVLTDGSVAPAVADWARASGMAPVPQLVTDQIDLPAPDVRPSPVGRETVMFLQYTSGSTHDPKGVQVDHGNLMANAAALLAFSDLGVGDTIGGWLPMYHDFGLIVQLLLPMFLGCRAALMSPSAFLRRPHSWLHLLHRHRVALSSAPNFAYDLCARRVTDEQVAGVDLTTWRYAVSGAEPVHARTLRAFRDRFAVLGLRPQAITPGYGMAEATLMISGNGCLAEPVVLPVDAAMLERHAVVPATPATAEARELVSSGEVADGFEVRIVDPDSGTVLGPDRIGEIWVQGASVTRGYWKRPEQTTQTFNATTANGQSGFLRTGDLGVLRDGQLYVTGRIKEMLVVAGRNLYPYDIEVDARSTHPSLAKGASAVFGVDSGREEVVVVQESVTRSRDERTLHDTATAIRDLVGREHGVSASVVLVRPGTVPRTTSGKIQRGLARQMFLKGSLAAEYLLLTPALEAFLADSHRARAGLARVA